MTDLFALAGRHALVTGASGGLGRHFAESLARVGARVTVAARRADARIGADARIESAGGRAQAVVMDVTDAGSIEAAPYAVSKAAMIHLTNCLAPEWARHGIRVNALAPGFCKTDIDAAFLESEQGAALVRRIPQRRTGRLEDVDGPLPASKAGAFMTGNVVVVDGGHMVAGLWMARFVRWRGSC